MCEPPKQVSERVETAEELTHELDHVNKELIISEGTTESKSRGSEMKVGILALHMSVTECERDFFENYYALKSDLKSATYLFQYLYQLKLKFWSPRLFSEYFGRTIIHS